VIDGHVLLLFLLFIVGLFEGGYVGIEKFVAGIAGFVDLISEAETIVLALFVLVFDGDYRSVSGEWLCEFKCRFDGPDARFIDVAIGGVIGGDGSEAGGEG
jgi:hypothetical protein